MSCYEDKINDMVWSFSRLNLFHTCPLSFKLTYLTDGTEKQNNAFAEFGSLCHSVLEDYAKEKLEVFELEQAYNDRFNDYLIDDFPMARNGISMGDSYYEKGLNYFKSFEGFDENWKCIGVEKHFSTEVNGSSIQGYIDLLMQDETDGEYIIIDHKSKSKFKNAKELEHYAIQLYIYARAVFEEYGKFPKQLIFNMFRDQEFVVVDFNIDSYEQAMHWIEDTVTAIRNESDFKDKIEIQYASSGKDISEYKNNDFFCRYLCNCRHLCERSGQS